MITRTADMALIRSALRRSRVVALLGPRQCGKTTLARELVPPDSLNYFDLEDPQSLARLAEPDTALRPLKKLVVIDEIQRRPDLFPLLRVLADRRPLPARFLILGSASPDLLRQSSESLAGRIETLPSGGFPALRSGCRCTGSSLAAWRFPARLHGANRARFVRMAASISSDFSRARLPQLGITIPALALRRFWNMIAHYHGQIWSGSELARALSLSEPTVRRYLDLMADVFMLRQLPPWFENLGKRQVKAPKVYVRDSGLLHALLGIANRRDLEFHPKVGASWEGYAVEEVLKSFRPGRGLLLGHAQWRGARSPSIQKRTPHRHRVQACRCAGADTVYADSSRRPQTRSVIRPVSWRQELFSGKEGRGHPAGEVRQCKVNCRHPLSVILSAAEASRSEAPAESKDPMPAWSNDEPSKAFSRRSVRVPNKSEGSQGKQPD